MVTGKPTSPVDGVMSTTRKKRVPPFFRKMHAKLTPPSLSFRPSRYDRLPGLIDSHSTEHCILNLGAGATTYREDIINVDIRADNSVHIVADVLALPIADSAADLVISQAVLEHVRDPWGAGEEILRILKPGGVLYCEVPFLQPFHSAPSDFFRYTLSGVEELCGGCKTLEKGVIIGPSSALAWILRTYLSIVLSFDNVYLFKFWELIFGWLMNPLKFLDAILVRRRLSYLAASGVYFIGRKAE